MSAPTAEGVIYALDFRLRPSGNAGPLATRFSAFLKYQQEEAWTWERQALTRARPVAGDPAFCAEIESALQAILARPSERQKLSADIREMRALVDKEKATPNPFEVKTAKGGLVDVEFIAQWAMLSEPSNEGPAPTATIDMLRHASAKILPPSDADLLVEAVRLYNTVQQVLRLCTDEPFDPATSPAGLSQMVCAHAALPDIRAVEAALKDTQMTVRECFYRLLG
jgi:glutamate-ammonia-ligase adenylyltransferase